MGFCPLISFKGLFKNWIALLLLSTKLRRVQNNKKIGSETAEKVGWERKLEVKYNGRFLLHKDDHN